jgi:hypothetical protein
MEYDEAIEQGVVAADGLGDLSPTLAVDGG